MKKIKIIAAIAILGIVQALGAQTKSKEEHIKALSAGTDNDKIQACKFLGKEKKDKTAISEIINTLNNTDSSKVKIACSTALGYIAVKGDSTTALKNVITNTDNTDVVYAALLAIYNISVKNETLEEDAKSAYNYAKANHGHDEFIADAVAKIESRKTGK